MNFQQELWLILVGFIVALVVKKSSGSPAPMRRIALFASIASLWVGWFGMAIKGAAPALAFFPTDVRGILITALAAFLAAKFVVRQPRRVQSKNNSKKPNRS